MLQSKMMQLWLQQVQYARHNANALIKHQSIHLTFAQNNPNVGRQGKRVRSKKGVLHLASISAATPNYIEFRVYCQLDISFIFYTSLQIVPGFFSVVNILGGPCCKSCLPFIRLFYKVDLVLSQPAGLISHVYFVLCLRSAQTPFPLSQMMSWTLGRSVV